MIKCHRFNKQKRWYIYIYYFNKQYISRNTFQYHHCLEQYIILHELASAMWYTVCTALINIPQPNTMIGNWWCSVSIVRVQFSSRDTETLSAHTSNCNNVGIICYTTKKQMCYDWFAYYCFTNALLISGYILLLNIQL
jgi:hypothetical protein